MENNSAWDVVKIARDPRRLSCMDYIENIFTDFIELHGDRFYGDDPAVVTGFAYFEDLPVMVLAQNRGRGGEDSRRCNYGMARPEGNRKARRAAKLAEKWNIPIISFVDTPGADANVESEYRGQASSIANNLLELLDIKVAMISILIGQGGSGGALALAVSDQLLMLKNATYSILSPEGLATILYRNVSKAQEAAESMRLTAENLVKLNIIEGIIDEAPEGNWTDPERTYRSMREKLRKALIEDQQLSSDELVKLRKYKFRNI